MSNRQDDHRQQHNGNDTESYRFNFNADQTTVTGMAEIERGRLETKSLRGWTFEVEKNTDGRVDAVERSQLQRGIQKVERYADADGDGLFTEVFSAKLVTATASDSKLDFARFTFDTDGDVLGMQELSKGRWKTERLDANERLEVQEIDGQTYVVKIETERNETSLSFYRDDNQDGLWTEVAEVEAALGVDLVGVSTVLAVTEGFVG